LANDELAEAIEIEAIKHLKARYFRFLDTKRWDEWRLQFCDDCVFEGISTTFADADDFVAGIARQHARTRTVHHGHTPEIELLTATTARGIWAMADYVTWPPDEPLASWAVDDEMHGFVGYGYYEEEYRRVIDGWRIARLRLTRIRVDPLRGPAAEPLPNLLAPSPDWLPLR